MILKNPSVINVGNGLGREKERQRHRLQLKPAPPLVTITALASQLGSGSGERSGTTNTLRKDSTPKAGARTVTPIQHSQLFLYRIL